MKKSLSFRSKCRKYRNSTIARKIRLTLLILLTWRNVTRLKKMISTSNWRSLVKRTTICVRRMIVPVLVKNNVTTKLVHLKIRLLFWLSNWIARRWSTTPRIRTRRNWTIRLSQLKLKWLWLMQLLRCVLLVQFMLLFIKSDVICCT